MYQDTCVLASYIDIDGYVTKPTLSLRGILLSGLGSLLIKPKECMQRYKLRESFFQLSSSESYLMGIDY